MPYDLIWCTARTSRSNCERPRESRTAKRLQGFSNYRGRPSSDRGSSRKRRSDAYFVGPFLLAWLGGWFVGFGDTVSKMWSGEVPHFLNFWLVGWSLVGAMAMFLAYRAFRPCVPKSLRMMPNSVTSDSGFPRLRPCFLTTCPQRTHGNSCFQKGCAWSLIGRDFSRCV